MNIEDELSKLQPEEQQDEKNDVSLFKSVKKKKKKSKLFNEINSILEDDGRFEDLVKEFKTSGKKKKNSYDDDLFDTKGKDGKKSKNLENKFKAELNNLQKVLKDNEDLCKNIKDILGPTINSKARGSSKMLLDLIISLNSSLSNRLATIKEIGNLKKSIIELKIKLDKDNPETEGIPADQFGSRMFAELFKQGRANVIDNVNGYEQDLDSYVNSMGNDNFEDIRNNRLDNEKNTYRSDDANKMIGYEYRQPEICVQKAFDGTVSVVAIDNNGVVIDDYPVPTVDQLGKLSFNTDTGTCTDITGRTFRVIEP